MANKTEELKIKINGIEKVVLAEVIDKKFWCYVDGETFSFDVSDIGSRSIQGRRGQNKEKQSHLIVAPMPGKITKIFVKVGDQVNKSQPLLVMEAMKMEYTLKADLQTTLEKINVQVGDQVALGSLLIELRQGLKEKV